MNNELLKPKIVTLICTERLFYLLFRNFRSCILFPPRAVWWSRGPMPPAHEQSDISVPKHAAKIAFSPLVFVK